MGGEGREGREGGREAEITGSIRARQDLRGAVRSIVGSQVESGHVRSGQFRLDQVMTGHVR